MLSRTCDPDSLTSHKIDFVRTGTRIYVIKCLYCQYVATLSKQREREALPSQRGRAMLRVIEYFAKPLKTTQGYSK